MFFIIPDNKQLLDEVEQNIVILQRRADQKARNVKGFKAGFQALQISNLTPKSSLTCFTFDVTK